MIKLREWATIRAALLFWQEEMCPSGSTIMRPYYDVEVEVEESLGAEEVEGLRARLSESSVRYAAFDPATGRLASIELIVDAEEAIRLSDDTSAIATVIIPTNTQPMSY